MNFHPGWWDQKALGANRSRLISKHYEMYLVDCERDTCGLFLLTLLNLSLQEHQV